MNKPSKHRDARTQRLADALGRVEQSIRCTAATMRSALARDEWQGYTESAALCWGPALTRAEKTHFERYRQCLRRGDLIYARAMKLSPVGREALRRTQLLWAADREYAAAWEILEQLLASNPFVQTLLDRPFEECAAEPEDIARPVDSASQFAKRLALGRELTLLRCQKATLLQSLSRLREETIADTQFESSAHTAALSWDALFGFADRTDKPSSVSVIDDSWSANTDALLPQSGAHRELL